MNTFQRSISRLLIACLIGLGVPMPAGATLIGTGHALQSPARAEVSAFLQREDVRSQLQALGVNPAAAHERVSALSDEEVVALAGRIDDAPAAGADVIGALLFVFIVLLVTDILGFTKVFPFTRSVR